MASRGTEVSGIAERYATALFELADEQKALDQVADDLTAVKAMLGESADLRRLVRSPMLSREGQARAIGEILQQAGASELTRRFVDVVANNRRLFALQDMIEAYLSELARRRGEVVANVTAATKLTQAQTNALIDQLKKTLGAKVTVNVTVDPDLLGGMIVKVGSRMIDFSLRTKLSKLQLAMKGVG